MPRRVCKSPRHVKSASLHATLSLQVSTPRRVDKSPRPVEFASLHATLSLQVSTPRQICKSRRHVEFASLHAILSLQVLTPHQVCKSLRHVESVCLDTVWCQRFSTLRWMEESQRGLVVYSLSIPRRLRINLWKFIKECFYSLLSCFPGINCMT
jgi:hypothetical protein